MILRHIVDVETHLKETMKIDSDIFRVHPDTDIKLSKIADED